MKRYAIAGAVVGLLVTLALLLCQPAHATEWPVTSNATMASANSGAQAGDVVTVAAGTYTTLPNPTNSGTSYANRITYALAPTTTLSGSLAFSKSHITVTGGSVTGDVTFAFAATSCILQGAAVRGSLLQRGQRNKVTSCTFNGFNGNTTWQTIGNVVFNSAGGAASTLTAYAQADTLENSRFFSTYAAGDGFIIFGGRGTAYCLVDSCTFGTTVPASGNGADSGQLHEWYWTHHLTVRRSVFTTVNNADAATTNNKLWLSIRDSAYAITYDRNLFNVSGTNTENQSYWNNGGSWNTTSGNTFSNNTIKQSGSNEAFRIGMAPIGDVYHGNQFASESSVAFYALNGLGTATIRHNTFYSGAGNCFYIEQAASSSTMRQNLFASTTTTGTCATYGQAVSLMRDTLGATSDSSCWYNFFNSGNDSARAIQRFNGFPVGCLAPRQVRPYNRWGNPQFTNTTWATLDLTPGAGSLAKGPSGHFADGYAGAISTAPAADVTSPDAIADLAVTSFGNQSVTLSWTATGDDASTGTCTSYDLRYRAGSTIDQSLWASSIEATGEPVPAIAGTAQSMTITDITNDVQYAFGLKASDDAGNASFVSNAVTATPRYVDEIAPTAVSNLDGTAGDRQASLTWTSTIDDGPAGTMGYELRYRVGSSFVEANWASATSAAMGGCPATFLSDLSATATGLTNGTQYAFAVKLTDVAGNASELSNVVLLTPADAVAPATITDLSVTSTGAGTVGLRWTSPDEDGSNPQGRTAASYDVRFRVGSTFVEDNWAAASSASGEPAVTAVGTTQTMTVSSGLSDLVTYAFAIKAIDEVPNTGAISNAVVGTPNAGADITAPSAISTLAVALVGDGQITLVWTCVGDDAAAGTATTYTFKRSTAAITAINFDAATTISGPPAPKAAGLQQAFTVTGLPNGTPQYFAMKVADEIPNTSAVSNFPSAATPVAPIAAKQARAGGKRGTRR